MPNNGNNAEVLKHSVTAGDYTKSPYDGSGILTLFFPQPVGTVGDLPQYWTPARDRILRTSPMRESMWASAVHIAVSKVATRDWRLDGRKVTYWQELLLAADDNQSFVAYQEKQVKDFLLTDNGNFTEIVRVSNARGSRIIGLQHLPSWRVVRTNDPSVPCIYRDKKGYWHEMRDYQVLVMSDEPEEDMYYAHNVGFCSASRAWNAIMKLSALEQYVYEKISGKRPLDIALVNASIKEKQLQDAVDSQKERSLEQGYVQYMGVVMIPILDPSASPAVAHIPIAGLPDGFDPKEERLQGQIVYADALGLDPTTLNPELAARGRALGSGAQAQVLDDKESGKGIQTFGKKQAHLFNEYVLPDRVMYSMYETDLVDMSRRATIRKDNYDAMRIAVGNGQSPPILTPEQAKNVLVDLNELSPEYLSQDLNADEVLRDAEKPDIALDAEHTAPPDKALMQTEQKPVSTPFGNSQGNPSSKAIAQTKAWQGLVERAKEWLNPILPDAVEDMDEIELIRSYNLAHTQQPNINITFPEIKLPTTVLPEIKLPGISVAAPQITLKEAASQFTFNLPASQVPQIQVAAPNVNVTNEVPIPVVNVAAPEVNITNDVQTPEVNITNENTVNVPEGEREEVLDVIRGESGLIQRVVKRITNGS